MSNSDLTIHGRIVRDIEIRFSEKGTAVGKTAVAWNERVRDAAGNWGDGPGNFLNVVAFGQMAEMMAETLGKGDLVIASGALKQNDYTTKDGDKRTSYEFMLDDIGKSLKWLEKKQPARPQNVTGTTVNPADYPDEVPFL